MESRYAKRIKQDFRHLMLPPIQSLEIPDEFQFMDPELIDFLRDGIEDAIANWVS